MFCIEHLFPQNCVYMCFMFYFHFCSLFIEQIYGCFPNHSFPKYLILCKSNNFFLLPSFFRVCICQWGPIIEQTRVGPDTFFAGNQLNHSLDWLCLDTYLYLYLYSESVVLVFTFPSEHTHTCCPRHLFAGNQLNSITV